ncbi:ABC transporter permease [Actinomycetota bacterium Odt1-20B]
MTATTGLASPTATGRAQDARPRFRDLLAAEWIKLWALRSTPWSLGLAALVVVALNANAAYADYLNWPRYEPAVRAGFAPAGALRDAFTDGAAAVLMLVACGVGAMVLVGEFAQGLVRTTFAAVPARRSLVAAKVTVVAGVMTAYGAVCSLASFWATQSILARRGAEVSLGDPGALRVVLASALLAPVCALAGLGIGSVVRHGAGSVAVTTLGLIMLPSFIDDRKYHWAAVVRHATPMGAWEQLVAMSVEFMRPDPYPATVAGSWTVLGLWALGAAALAVVTVDRRDV